ncbi:hypothetical protein RRG08_057877 [Elysia crispata]|uniref:Uncharacterized protein n=1 Tax=Elysia crispata TaxID=231223 RepID=A0AAE1B2U7_9GAST|nr:hypothetical protein RRG08_057877 [Elysia crispata]
MAVKGNDRRAPSTILCLFLVFVIVASLISPLLLIAHTAGRSSSVTSLAKDRGLEFWREQNNNRSRNPQGRQESNSEKDEKEENRVSTATRNHFRTQNGAAQTKENKVYTGSESRRLSENPAISLRRSYEKQEAQRNETMTTMGILPHLKAFDYLNNLLNFFDIRFPQMYQNNTDVGGDYLQKRPRADKMHRRFKRNVENLNQTGLSDHCVTFKMAPFPFTPQTYTLTLTNTNTENQTTQQLSIPPGGQPPNYTHCNLETDHAYDATLEVRGQGPNENVQRRGVLTTRHRFPIAPGFLILTERSHTTLTVHLPKLIFYDGPETSREVRIKRIPKTKNTGTPSKNTGNKNKNIGIQGGGGTPYIKPKGRGRRKRRRREDSSHVTNVLLLHSVTNESHSHILTPMENGSQSMATWQMMSETIVGGAGSQHSSKTEYGDTGLIHDEESIQAEANGEDLLVGNDLLSLPINPEFDDQTEATKSRGKRQIQNVSTTPAGNTATSAAPVGTTSTVPTPASTTSTSSTPAGNTATSAAPVGTTSTVPTPASTTSTSSTPVGNASTTTSSGRRMTTTAGAAGKIATTPSTGALTCSGTGQPDGVLVWRDSQGSDGQLVIGEAPNAALEPSTEYQVTVYSLSKLNNWIKYSCLALTAKTLALPAAPGSTLWKAIAACFVILCTLVLLLALYLLCRRYPKKKEKKLEEVAPARAEDVSPEQQPTSPTLATDLPLVDQAALPQWQAIPSTTASAAPLLDPSKLPKWQTGSSTTDDMESEVDDLVGPPLASPPGYRPDTRDPSPPVTRPLERHWNPAYDVTGKRFITAKRENVPGSSWQKATAQRPPPAAGLRQPFTFKDEFYSLPDSRRDMSRNNPMFQDPSCHKYVWNR